MLPLVDEAKRERKGRETKISIQKKFFFCKNQTHFLIFLFFIFKISVKNKGFEVLKTKKLFFLLDV